jgi:RNA polymerase sigma-70 factor (ECF subfamily)
MSKTTDISLVAQVAVFGNGWAFDELVRRYQSSVRRFFLNQTLGDSQLSDDLSQDTFIKAYTNIRSFRGLASFQTWLMRIAYNVFYDYVRKEKVKVNSEQFSSDTSSVECVAAANSCISSVASELSSSASLFTLHSSLKMDLYAALALLKPDERTCITLQLIDGYDIAGIAKITGLKEGTVKSHLSRGKEKLATYLRQNGYDR